MFSFCFNTGTNDICRQLTRTINELSTMLWNERACLLCVVRSCCMYVRCLNVVLLMTCLVLRSFSTTMPPIERRLYQWTGVLCAVWKHAAYSIQKRIYTHSFVDQVKRS